MIVELPLTLNDITPGDGFARMEMPRLEGMHTGGPFLSPDGQEVWKPLDCRPFPNCLCRIATKEDTVLEIMAGRVGFPRNWRIEVANDRRWLVRKVAYVIPETFEKAWVTREHVLQVEQAVRALNAKYWEVGDKLKIAIDPDTYEPFILDLSNANLAKNAAGWLQADNHAGFETWADEVVGFSSIVQLRRNARRVVSSAAWELDKEKRGHRWVYGSWHRPMDGLWPGTSIPDAIYVAADKAKTDMHTWVVAPYQLSDEIVSRYQLQFGWAPIAYEKEQP